MPIIMLTGLNAEEDVVRGLEAGANDYVAKPFRFNELLARLRSSVADIRRYRGCRLHDRTLYIPTRHQDVAGSR